MFDKKEYMREYMREYNILNKEKLKEKKKLYRANPDVKNKLKEYVRQYKIDNREEHLKYQREWAAKKRQTEDYKNKLQDVVTSEKRRNYIQQYNQREDVKARKKQYYIDNKPVKVKEPKPVKVKQPKPVKVKQPKPVKIKQPKPVKVKQPKPVKIKEPKPVKIKEPKPVIEKPPKERKRYDYSEKVNLVNKVCREVKPNPQVLKHDRLKRLFFCKLRRKRINFFEKEIEVINHYDWNKYLLPKYTSELDKAKEELEAKKKEYKQQELLSKDTKDLTPIERSERRRLRKLYFDRVKFYQNEIERIKHFNYNQHLLPLYTSKLETAKQQLCSVY